MVFPIQAQPPVPEPPAPRDASEAAHSAEAKKSETPKAPVHQPNPAPAAPHVEVSLSTRVQLSVDAQLRETIIKVVDPETGKVVRQIPQEEVVRLQRAYAEAQQKTAAKGQGEVA